MFSLSSTSPCRPPRTKKKKKKKKTHHTTTTVAMQRPPNSSPPVRSLIGFQFLFPTLAWLLSDIDIDNPGTLLRIALVYIITIIIIIESCCMAYDSDSSSIIHPSKPAKHRNRPKRDQRKEDQPSGPASGSNSVLVHFFLHPSGVVCKNKMKNEK